MIKMTFCTGPKIQNTYLTPLSAFQSTRCCTTSKYVSTADKTSARLQLTIIRFHFRARTKERSRHGKYGILGGASFPLASFCVFVRCKRA